MNPSAVKMFHLLILSQSSLLLDCLAIATLSGPVIAVVEAPAIAALMMGSVTVFPFSFVFIMFSFFLSLINLFILFIYFWLRWVFVAACGLPLVAASGGLLFLAMRGLLIAVASLVAEHGL